MSWMKISRAGSVSTYPNRFLKDRSDDELVKETNAVIFSLFLQLRSI